jgi:[ribosomal protein S5]-alanine N-acetyltransferase
MTFETLETKRLRLSVLSPDDLRSIFENFTKPDIKKILGHRSEEEYQKEERKHKNGYSCYNRSFKLFLMTDKVSETVIGRCGLHNWNAEHCRAEIGYVIHDDNFKNKGLMTEAVELIISYGFSKMNLHRIEALVSAENNASLKLLNKYNFTREGLLRQHYLNNGKYDDSLVFSLLLSEYTTHGNKQKNE